MNKILEFWKYLTPFFERMDRSVPAAPTLSYARAMDDEY